MYKGCVLSSILGLCLLISGPAVPGLDGKLHRPLDAKAKAVVLIFVTTECPIANAYAPEIKRIIAAYQPNGISFYLVNVDPAIQVADARTHAKDYGYTCPILLDRKHVLVRLGPATATPEVAVYIKGRLAYLGRIDNRYFALGKQRPKITSQDLRNVLDEIGMGKAPKFRRTQVVGCLVPPL